MCVRVRRKRTGASGGEEESVFVSDADSSDESSSSDGRFHHRYVFAELLFEDGVKVFRLTDANETIFVGELGEDADFVRILELGAGSHDAGFFN